MIEIPTADEMYERALPLSEIQKQHMRDLEEARLQSVLADVVEEIREQASKGAMQCLFKHHLHETLLVDELTRRLTNQGYRVLRQNGEDAYILWSK